MYDVLVVGGGACGCAIARLLCRYRLRIALLEAQNDVAMGATKANSAIVHGGYAEAHTTLKGRLCHKGRVQFAQLERELHFGFKPIGSLVLAFEEAQRAGLEEMLQNGRANGLADLHILPRERVLEMEPNVSPAVHSALYCEGAGVCSPFAYAAALAENAVQNGAELYLNTPVASIQKQADGFCVTSADGRRFESRFVVNAAGLGAGTVAAMVGAATFTLHPRSGEYVLLNRGSGALLRHVLFQMPTAMGKGILATPTVYGNLLLGPDAIDEVRDDRSTHPERLYHIYKAALQSAPGIDISRFLRSFAGVRAVADSDDFIVEQSAVPGFIQVAGIQSPGLTSSPAIAQLVRDILADAGLSLTENPAYNPQREATSAPYPNRPPEEMGRLLALPMGAAGRMLCRCEQVEEAAVRSAAARGVPLHSVDAAKRRTRAGMGYCQGKFCRPRTAALLGELSGRPVTAETDAEAAGLTRVARDEMLAYCKAQKG